MWEFSSDSIYWTSFIGLSQCLLILPPNDGTRPSYLNVVLFAGHHTTGYVKNPVGQIGTGKRFLRTPRLSPVGITRPMLHTHLSVTDAM
jgi:hypothetical protein